MAVKVVAAVANSETRERDHVVSASPRRRSICAFMIVWICVEMQMQRLSLAMPLEDAPPLSALTVAKTASPLPST